MPIEQLPQMIDISCVKTDSTLAELTDMVALARRHRFICCFAMPCFTPWLAEELAGTGIRVGGAVGFPSGADTTATKVEAARQFVKLGCAELDMVIQVGWLKSGWEDMVLEDIRRVRDAAGDRILKVILEVAYLTNDEIRRGSELAVRGGADYVKTGTGWAACPTTVDHVRLIRDAIGDTARIKAAGGVRTLEDVETLTAAGCSRFGIGLRSTRRILQEAGWDT